MIKSQAKTWREIAPPISASALDGVMVRFTPQTLYLHANSLKPTVHGAGGPPHPVWTLWRTETSLATVRNQIQIPCLSCLQSSAILIECPGLHIQRAKTSVNHLKAVKLLQQRSHIFQTYYYKHFETVLIQFLLQNLKSPDW
jgi:hypothetical protein